MLVTRYGTISHFALCVVMKGGEADGQWARLGFEESLWMGAAGHALSLSQREIMCLEKELIVGASQTKVHLYGRTVDKAQVDLSPFLTFKLTLELS